MLRMTIPCKVSACICVLKDLPPSTPQDSCFTSILAWSTHCQYPMSIPVPLLFPSNQSSLMGSTKDSA